MLEKYKNKMYCFSPPVMLATFIIEFGLAFYALWRYKMDNIRRLGVAMLISLGTFQLAEYMVCGGLGLSNIEWARVGYGSITLLPALGIHFIVSLADKKKPLLVTSAYASAALFVIVYLIGENAVSVNTCNANYAVFDTIRAAVWPFAAYYYGWLLVGTYLAWKWGNELPKKRKALQAMSIGYMAFILPTTAFNIIDPATVQDIPSIMCGFAVIYAVVLSTRVLPASCKVKNRHSVYIEELYKKFNQ